MNAPTYTPTSAMDKLAFHAGIAQGRLGMQLPPEQVISALKMGLCTLMTEIISKNTPLQATYLQMAKECPAPLAPFFSLFIAITHASGMPHEEFFALIFASIFPTTTQPNKVIH